MKFINCYSCLPRELQTALAQDEITPHYGDAEVYADMYAEYDSIKDTYPHRESWVTEASQLTTMPQPQITYVRHLDKLNTHALSAKRMKLTTAQLVLFSQIQTDHDNIKSELDHCVQAAIRKWRHWQPKLHADKNPCT